MKDAIKWHRGLMPYQNVAHPYPKDEPDTPFHSTPIGLNSFDDG